MKKVLTIAAGTLLMLSMTGCGHEHEFTEATCTSPAQCIECGEITGEVLPHSFTEATCTEAKTCLVCGYVEGEAVGHSVSFGLCNSCGAFVNEQVIVDIVNIDMAAMRSANVAEEYISEANKYNDLELMYRNYCSAVTYYEKYQSKLKEAYAICIQYSELSGLKNKIDKVICYDLSKPKNSTVDELADFIDRLVEFTYLKQEYAYAMIDVVESIPE